MENSTQIITKLSELAQVVLEKLKAEETDVTLDFQDMSVQGPGPNGQPGNWRLNGKLTLKAKSKGQDNA
ncbi:hypothetical protein TH63_06390 [Rufibacter radiotolerans]|uniref:Uncharacterized protein n=1 Tax=Rufibacter radiotolerans TaxID=1379910 RepID=A0A0H4VIY1_9BACT|nr:hypothetical protein [Rufibacter radiotolerans]AKQ45348.1 hypothetical protein TH63_06390 [Rufibacter radiotolerans]